MKRLTLVFHVHDDNTSREFRGACGEFRQLANESGELPSPRETARALRDVAEYFDREADREARPAPTFEPGDQVVFTGDRARLVELGLVDDAVTITNVIGTVVRRLSRQLGSVGETIGVSYANVERRCAFQPSDLALVRKGRL